MIELVDKTQPLKHRRPSRGQCAAVAAHFADGEKEPTGLSCLECDGALLEIKNRKEIRYRCHVGHSFSLESFSEAHTDALERALWVALRRLNEQQLIQENLARGSTDPSLRKRHHENIAAVKRDIELLHEILARL